MDLKESIFKKLIDIAHHLISDYLIIKWTTLLATTQPHTE